MSTTIATLAAGALAASLAFSGVALAGASVHYTDGQYLAAARCEGLMASKALGPEDVTSIEAVLRTQSAGPDLAARADDARLTAARQAAHAGPQAKAALIAERDGACQSFAAGASVSAIARPATTN